MKKITLLAAIFAVSFMNAQITVFEDSFESYDDFAIDNIGDWTQIDLDGDPTYGFSSGDFPNSSYIGTGIIFNPSTANPPRTGGIEPRTGSKTLNFFAATGGNSGTAQNNDYFISPQIDLTNTIGSALSVWAKSLTVQYGPDQFEMAISTTGTNVGDFTAIGAVNMPGETEYTEYTYDLSSYDGQQIYIAFHVISPDTFVLIVDDFKVTAASLGVTDKVFEGFTYFIENDNLNLSANTPMAKVELYNLLGQSVIVKTSNSTKEAIDISGLKTGVYVANVIIDGSKKAFKFVKE